MPKEKAIREMLARLGIKLPAKPRKLLDESQSSEESDVAAQEESGEEEPCTDDEECKGLSIIHACSNTPCSFHGYANYI